MTTKIKDKGIYQGQVLDVQHAYKMKGEKHLHLITFGLDDGSRYIAEEAENDPKSRFTVGTKARFELLHPGKPGTLDWVRYISVVPAAIDGAAVAAAPRPATPSREDFIAANTAMQCATELGIKMDWSVDEIVNTAYTLAGNIKVIAKNISEEIVF